MIFWKLSYELFAEDAVLENNKVFSIILWNE